MSIMGGGKQNGDKPGRDHLKPLVAVNREAVAEVARQAAQSNGVIADRLSDTRRRLVEAEAAWRKEVEQGLPIQNGALTDVSRLRETVRLLEGAQHGDEDRRAAAKAAAAEAQRELRQKVAAVAEREIGEPTREKLGGHVEAMLQAIADADDDRASLAQEFGVPVSAPSGLPDVAELRAWHQRTGGKPILSQTERRSIEERGKVAASAKARDAKAAAERDKRSKRGRRGGERRLV